MTFTVQREVTLFGDFNELGFCCGVEEIGDFMLEDGADLSHSLGESLRHPANRSGTGFYIATFIDTEECRFAYETIKQHKRLLFQSVPRRNKKSGKDVFIIVCQDKE